MKFWALLTVAAALNCTSPGKEVEVPATTYYCDGAQVPADVYSSYEPQSQCYQKRVTAPICMCPADTYGSECQELRPLVCNLTVTAPGSSQCGSPEGYNDRLPGLPSCFQVPADGSISTTVVVMCETLNPGVTIVKKPPLADLDLADAVSQAGFSYAFNSSGVFRT